MPKLCYVSFSLYLLCGVCLLLANFSGYTLQEVYAFVLVFLTLSVTAGAIWQIGRSRLRSPRKFGLLALHGAALMTALLVVGFMFLESKLVDNCMTGYTSPSHQRVIAIKDVCLFDCDSYLYLQSFIFEKEIAKIVDDGGGFCHAKRYNNAHLNWSADERQIEWTADGQQGVVRLE